MSFTKKEMTFTKIAICFVLINSELQIWASYLLAFLGMDAIAEALSQQIVVTIIGTLIGYFVKSLLENLGKYTTLFEKKIGLNEEGLEDAINSGLCEQVDNYDNYEDYDNYNGNDEVDETNEDVNDVLCDGINIER